MGVSYSRSNGYSQAEIDHVVRFCDASKRREKTGLTNCIANLKILAAAIKLSKCSESQAKHLCRPDFVLNLHSKLSLSLLELAQLQGCQEMFLTRDNPTPARQKGSFSLQHRETLVSMCPGLISHKAGFQTLLN